MKKFLFHAFLIIIGGIGVYIFPKYTFVFIILTLVLNLYSLFINKKEKNDLIDLVNIQAKQLLDGNLGNTYFKKIEDELNKSGKCFNLEKKLEGAFEINPNDIDSLSLLGSYKILNAFRRYFFLREKFYLDKKLNKDLDEIKNITEQGKKIAPNNPVFYNIMGMAYDFEGKHEQAQKEFIKSINLGNNYRWNINLATSYLMTKEYRKALKLLKIVQDKEVSSWSLDLNFGWTYQGLAHYKKAQFYFLNALKTKKKRVEVYRSISEILIRQKKLLKALKYDFFTFFFMLIGKHPIRIINLFLFTFFLKLIFYFIFIPNIIIGKICEKNKLLKKNVKKIFIIDLYDWVAACHFLKEKEFRSAFYHLRNAIKMVDSRPRHHNNIGICLYYFGRKKSAIRELEKAISLSRKQKYNIIYEQNINAIKENKPNLIVVC